MALLVLVSRDRSLSIQELLDARGLNYTSLLNIDDLLEVDVKSELTLGGMLLVG